MRRRVQVAVGACVVAFFLFFFFAPVIEFSVGIPRCHYGPIYGSLSFHFFNVGEVYFSGFSWMTSGFTVPLCL